LFKLRVKIVTAAWLFVTHRRPPAPAPDTVLL
jgi:hypothetical protein